MNYSFMMECEFSDENVKKAYEKIDKQFEQAEYFY